MKLLGMILLALGMMAVVYGGFSYTTEKADTRIGPVEIELRQQKRVNIPLWVGIAAGAAGIVLVLRKP